jgi:hypothetical protein
MNREITKRQEWLVVLGLFCATLLVLGAFWAILPAEYEGNQSSDYTSAYEPIARSIAAGEGIPLDQEIGLRYPPGFSILLAGVFLAADALGIREATALAAFQMISAALSVVFVYMLARLVWSPRLALLSALAWMTYPFFLWLTKQPNSELPYIPILYAAIYLVWRAVLRHKSGPRAWVHYAGAGALVGAAMLIRPTAIGMSVVLACIVMVTAAGAALRARLAYGLLIGLASVVVVWPWEASIYAHTGQIIPLSRGGALSIRDGLTFLVVPKGYRREVPVSPDVAELMQAIHDRRRETLSLGGVMGVLIEEGSQQPWALTKLMGIKIARSWYGTDSRALEMPTMALQIVYLALILWGTVYAWRQGGALRRMTGGNWLIVFYFWGLTLLVVPILRYMVPVMGLLMIVVPGVYLSLAARRGWVAPATEAIPSDY